MKTTVNSNDAQVSRLGRSVPAGGAADDYAATILTAIGQQWVDAG